MKDKKSLIGILCIVGFLVIALGIFLIVNKKFSKNSSSGSSANAESRISDIDWGSYDSNEITLTKSIKITEAGTYTLTGTIEDGLVEIDTDGNVKLILNGVSITNSSGPAIYVANADTVEIETVSGTTNTLTDGKTYSGYEDGVVGTIYSKDDLILSGDGTLKVVSNNEDAIVSKDDIKINSGTYIIDSADDGIRGKDSVEIIGGTFTINANGDGIKSTNDTDTDKGFILISGGNFTINANNDGIQAETELVISDGIFNIKTSASNDDSSKGLKAEKLIEITGGTFNIDTTDDGVHSNGNITINKGTFTIESDDDAVHADGLIEINGGSMTINAHEGIEATYVKINDGTININASDDGINAGNKSNDYDVTIEINGGDITIKMGQGDTDAVDSNGNIYINGGTLNITANSPFDYDGKAEYNGGTIIVNGEKTTTITNQFAGGMQGGMMPNEANMQDGNPQNAQGQRGGNRR